MSQQLKKLILLYPPFKSVSLNFCDMAQTKCESNFINVDKASLFFITD